MRECVSERVRECVSERVGECVSERMRECVSERERECVSERVRECVSERARENHTKETLGQTLYNKSLHQRHWRMYCQKMKQATNESLTNRRAPAMSRTRRHTYSQR